MKNQSEEQKKNRDKARNSTQRRQKLNLKKETKAPVRSLFSLSFIFFEITKVPQPRGRKVWSKDVEEVELHHGQRTRH